MTYIPTGPPYPQQPPADADDLGLEAAGAGGLPPFQYLTTIASQYANSPIMCAMIARWEASIDPWYMLSLFYDDIWNIDTASGYGLDVWGRIVGVTRVVTILSTNYFGFHEAGDVGFGQGPFFAGARSTENFALNDQTYRNLILAKAASNISSGSIQSINQILMMLFAGRGGNAYVTDGNVALSYFGFEEAGALGFGQAPFGTDWNDAIAFFGFSESPAPGFGQAPFYSPSDTIGMGTGMLMSYVFTFPLTPTDIGIINSGVLPKPVGVVPSIVQLA